MPQTVEEVTLAALGCAVLLVLTLAATRRWGLDPEPEPLVVLWRRWAAVGRAGAEVRQPPVPTAPEPRPPAAPERRQAVRPRRPARSTVMRAEGAPRDHVPLVSEAEEGRSRDRGEPRIAFRHRFRRGLKRARDRFGTDVKEALVLGPGEQSFEMLEEALVSADVGVATATELVDTLRELGSQIPTDGVRDALRNVMISHLTGADRRLRLAEDGVSVWLVVGVNGTGKTTSIAKLGARAKALDVPVCLAAADTFRAAAIEQLVAWGDRLDLDVVAQQAGADPGAVVFDAIAHARAAGDRLVIADTAGRLHTRKPLMDELAKVVRVIEREGANLAECLLLIDATTGQNGIAQAKAFKDAVGVTGVVLAKLDGSARGGITFAVERELEVPVKAVGVGEGHRDLVPFEPEAFVDALLGVE